MKTKKGDGQENQLLVTQPDDTASPHVHQIELEMQNETLRQAQQALEESRDRYVDLYEFAPVAYLTLTSDGMISEINLAGATLLGWERKKLLHKSLRTFVVAKDQDLWVRTFMSAIKQSEKSRVELSLQRDDGAAFQVQLDCGQGISGSKKTLQVILTDITERKLVEVALQESEELQRSVFNSILYHIVVLDHAVSLWLLTMPGVPFLWKTLMRPGGQLVIRRLVPTIWRFAKPVSVTL